MTLNNKYYVFTGPESSGKTTLSRWVASTYDLPLVTEYARSYLEELDRTYYRSDLEIISKGQIAHELDELEEANIICDTDLLNMIIWYEVKYGQIPKWLLNWFVNASNRLYLVCYPDIPWEYDPLRENPEDREMLLSRHLFYLNKYDKKYVDLHGNLDARKTKLKLIFNQIA